MWSSEIDCVQNGNTVISMRVRVLCTQRHCASTFCSRDGDGREVRRRRDALGKRCCDSHLHSPSPSSRKRRRGVLRAPRLDRHVP